MAENKTKPTRASVKKFLASVDHAGRREDAKILQSILEEVTGEKAVMWGESIVGFGQYSYTTDAGHSGTWPRIGYSPRKQNLVLYIMPGFSKLESKLKKIGPHKTGSSCLYFGRLTKVDLKVVKEICAWAWKEMNRRYPIGG